MAKSHKHESLGLNATTTLDDEAIAEMARAAADQANAGGLGVKALGSTTRLEEAQPGRLVFSVRGPGGIVELMVFEVTATRENGSATLQSAIVRYKTSQSTVAGFIPSGPKKMLGIDAYRKWIKNFKGSLEASDSSARVEVNGQVQKSIGEWM